MSTIDRNADLMTLVNVFTVEPENQEKLVTLLTEATEQVMRSLPGFVSANIHRSLDGNR
jgi:antibiotic biosynthesis monooxygenase (ABM) superfamily enzyme